MRALDTNMLVRFLVRDDELQAKKVLNRFKKAEKTKESLFISLLVILELIWVLEYVYNCSRQEIITAIENLAMLPIIRFENTNIVRGLIVGGRKTKQDLSDLLIGYSAKFNGCECTLTFDKSAAKSELFELI
jgi:predicted nucleic-acid-binding protein